MTGWRGLEYKERRKQRRRNHILKDLNKSKYHQRIIPNKKKRKYIDREEDYPSEEFDNE